MDLIELLNDSKLNKQILNTSLTKIPSKIQNSSLNKIESENKIIEQIQSKYVTNIKRKIPQTIKKQPKIATEEEVRYF